MASWTEADLLTVWHVCCRPCDPWLSVVEWQLGDLARVGLRKLLITHVGEGLPAVRQAAEKRGIYLEVLRSDPNTDHYETLAMFELERISKWWNGAFLYLHTKGVTQPGSLLHLHWRNLMHHYTVEPWREHLAKLAEGYDLAAFDWIDHGARFGHFTGNFWMARSDWVRQLDEFGPFHVRNGLTRFSCEQWIGLGQRTPNVHSERCRNVWWYDLPTIN